MVEEIRTEGGDLLTWQCSLCLEILQPCKTCGQALSPRHRAVSEGCTACGKGRFCNAQASLCDLCGPVPDGVCVECKKPFPQTGRQRLAKKIYCSKSCLDRAYRVRHGLVKGRLPLATEAVVDAP
jgi:hypothetical protein